MLKKPLGGHPNTPSLRTGRIKSHSYLQVVSSGAQDERLIHSKYRMSPGFDHF